MATRTVKQSNSHKPHPTHCVQCGSALPNRSYHERCATCRKGQIRKRPLQEKSA